MFSADNIKKPKKKKEKALNLDGFSEAELKVCPYFTLVLHKMEHLSRFHFWHVRILVFRHS